jgi:leucyl aminopeptidase
LELIVLTKILDPETLNLEDIDSDCLVLFITRDPNLAWLQLFTPDTQQYLHTIIEDGDLDSTLGATLLLNRPLGFASKRLLLVNLENAQKITERGLITACNKAMEALLKTNSQHVALYYTPKILAAQWLSCCAHALYHQSYRFTQFKTTPPAPIALQHIQWLVSDSSDHQTRLKIAQALNTGKVIARDLANMPPNICTPTYCLQQAQTLCQQYPSLSIENIDEQHMDELGMGAYLAVSRGSATPPVMSLIHYRGAASSAAPFVFIGKGVTFDTGGITLKKPDGMQNMIYDMCGATTVLGLMAAVAELALPLNVIGVLATVENMPDGNAYRPGDILTTMSGQTVEVISTDAEGRLILCDALTYVERFTPKAVIDIATLTGAAIVTLGHQTSGLMGNNDHLTQRLYDAGQQAHDRAWIMPLWDDYQDAIESTCADMMNAGKNSPGMISAGCFLARYTHAYPWAHLDVAGTSFQYGKGNSTTGRPLPLLLRFLLNESQ